MLAEIMRPLDPIERVFHTYADCYSVHFCLVAEIYGEIDVSNFANGLMALQSRHSTLAALIEKDAEGRPSFREPTGRPIPMTFAPLGPRTDWRSFVRNELAMPSAVDPAPLVPAGDRLRLTQARNDHVRSDLAEICGALGRNASV